MPFYFINMLPTSLLYISILLLCGLVCPSRTSERGGEGDCVKEGEGGEGERERERALGSSGYYATSLDIEVDPQRRCFGRRESDFARTAV